jgi:hypothetical protein
MDNASYHSRLVPGSVGPKTSWLKADIITHMMDNDIVPSELLPGYLSADEVQKQIDAMRLQGSGVSYIAPVWHPPLAVPAREAYERLTKPVLLAACPKLPKEYVVDEMCKQAGVECVRLPPYYCEFNPIELVWAHAKDRVKSQNTEFQLDAAMQIMRAACKEVGPEHWMKLEEHAKKVEKTIIEQDSVLLQCIGKTLDPIVITFDDDDEDDDEESVLDLDGDDFSDLGEVCEDEEGV